MHTHTHAYSVANTWMSCVNSKERKVSLGIVLATLIGVDAKVCDVTEMFLKQSSPTLAKLP